MSTSFDFDAPESLGGHSDLLSEAGTYHLLVMDVFPDVMPDGKSILTGGGFSVILSTLAGTVAGQEEKPLNLIFGNPKPDATEKSKGMAAAKKGAFFIACDLMRPDQLGARGLKISLDDAKGRQVIATLEPDSRTGKEKFLQLSYANMYHVDDPRAKDFPKAPAALALLPKSLRHDAAYFAKLLEKRPASASAPVRQTQLTASQLADL